MTEVILFHHVQGLTPGVVAFADRLRLAGHQVTVLDLFDGVVFESIDAGLTHLEDRGFERVLSSGVEGAETHSNEVVYVGFSLCALVAHKLAQTRSGAKGALLFHHGDVPVTMFGDSWPEGVDVQIHISEGDEWYEPDTVSQFVDAVSRSADADLFLYPGSTHLFADSSLDDYNGQAAELALTRTIEFLDNHT